MTASDLMYFHTVLRNVGLFTSISLATLGVSRFYRHKSKIYNIGFILFSLLFLFVGIFLNYSLFQTPNLLDTALHPIPFITMFLLCSMFCFAFVTFVCELIK